MPAQAQEVDDVCPVIAEWNVCKRSIVTGQQSLRNPHPRQLGCTVEVNTTLQRLPARLSSSSPHIKAFYEPMTQCVDLSFITMELFHCYHQHVKQRLR